mgnify:CR=1 FL=1
MSVMSGPAAHAHMHSAHERWRDYSETVCGETTAGRGVARLREVGVRQLQVALAPGVDQPRVNFQTLGPEHQLLRHNDGLDVVMTEEGNGLLNAIAFMLL